MPTYDYVCDACKHEFELFQPITASAKRKCPECNKLKLRRLIGAGAAIVFKGSGFYQTDYRSKSYQDQAAKEKKSNSSSESKSSDSKSSDSKKSDSKSSGKSDAGGKSSSD